MRRKQLTPLVFILVTAAAALGAVFATGTSPQLGLDLQGGISVVLQPTKDSSDEALSQTIEIIRSRVDALGVAEPEIARQGDAVVVQLPGVENQQRALELVGDTAELRFRPVLSSVSKADLEALEDAASSTTTTAADGSSTTTTTAADGSTTTTSAVTDQSGAGPATPFQDPTTTSTTAATTTTTTAPGETTTTTTPIEVPSFEVTPREDDVFEDPVTLEGDCGDGTDCIYQLGPAGASGQIVADADAQLGQDGQWTVALEVKGGDSIAAFNALAAECFARGATCPTGQLAIALDSVVQSAPTIQQAAFERDQIQISGSFSEREAKDLALVLRYGSLPVNLEPQTVQTVSPTLGEDSLRAGLIAGLVGLGLVVLYMIIYYRALGVVVLLGLLVWSALNYAIICWLGQTRGLALSLAGVTGLVVSVGVTVDSYVVYFERLKDDVRLGRTLRSSTARSWKRAFRTIIAANVSSLIGAVLLYMLTVGPVRGFAFFLALATALDVVVAWFFIRPVVSLMGRSRLFTEARWWGVARGLGSTARPGSPATTEAVSP
jgi:preprotein translocase subunit SecD